MKNKIIINGRACSGKDEIADYLVEKYGYIKISFATPIYEIAREYFEMTNKDRKLLQLIGEAMRSIDSDVWVKYAFKVANELDKVVIADLRRENEYTHAVKNGFTPIRVQADYDIRIERCIKRDGQYPDTSLWEDEVETGADNFTYEYEITNNGTLEELHRQIDRIMEVIN